MTPPIAFLVGAASANANTVAIATPQAGDLIVVFAYNNASTTVPTLVAGYTSLFSTTGANTNAHQLAYKVAAGSETNIGTWTNATGVVVQIVRAPLGSTPTGGIANGGSTGTSMSYTGITCTDLGGTSTLLAFGGHRTATNVGATAPTGMATSTSATSIAGFFEQNAAAFSTSAVTVNASSGYRFAVVEIRSATPLVQAASNDASAASVTVTLGANVTLGNTLSLITSFTAGTCVVSDNLGNVWSSRPAVSIASFGSDFQQRFLAPVTAAGAITVTITATGSAAVSGNLSEWMGAWQFDAGNATNDALGGGTSTSPASVSVTPAVGRAVVLGWEENASAGTATAGLGYTLLSQTPAGKIATAFQYQGPKPIATTAKFTIASALWAATAGILVPVPEPPLLAPRAAQLAAALALAWTAVWSVQSTPLPLAALIPPPAPITAPPLPSPPWLLELWRPDWTPQRAAALPPPSAPIVSAPPLVAPVLAGVSEQWRPIWNAQPAAKSAALVPTLAPQTYYVANAGSDSNDGLSTLTPFQTLTHAFSVASAGDTVLANGGDTFRETATFSAASQTLGSYGTGLPIISGADVASGWASYVAGDYLDGSHGAIPISWWMFEDGASPSLDGNGANANDLSWHSGATQTTTHVQGSFAMSLPTSSANVQRSNATLSSNFPFKAATTAFTFGGWVHIAGAPSGFQICQEYSDGSSTGILMQYASGGQMRLQCYGNVGVNTILGDNVVSEPDWHHVVARYDGATLSFFVDGVKQATTIAVASIPTSSSNLFFFPGATTGSQIIDEWFMFARSLSDADVASIFTNGLAGERATAQYWQVAATTQPTQVYVNGARAALGSSIAALANGEWFWASNVLYYRDDSGDPDTLGLLVEIAIRARAVDTGGFATPTMEKFIAQMSSGVDGGVYLSGLSLAASTIARVTSQKHYASGIHYDDVTASSDITDSTVTANGLHGIGYLGGGFPGPDLLVAISRTTVEDNGWNAVALGIPYPAGVFGTWASGAIVDNDITNNGLAGTGGEAHGIYQANEAATSTLVISDNRISGHANGLAIKATASAMITRNECFSNAYGALNLGPNNGSTTVVIVATFNEMYGNALSGGAGMDVIAASGSFTLKYYNNVFYENSGGSSAGEIFFENALTAIDGRNNIVYASGSGCRHIRSVTQTGAVAIDYNDYFNGDSTPFVYNGSFLSFAGWQAEAFTPDTHSVTADPLFVDSSTGNFHLSAGSPAIEAGVAIPGVTDGYAGSAPDMGLYVNDGVIPPLISPNPLPMFLEEWRPNWVAPLLRARTPPSGPVVTLPPLVAPPIPWATVEAWRPIWLAQPQEDFAPLIPAPVAPPLVLVTPAIPLGVREAWRPDWTVPRALLAAAFLPSGQRAPLIQPRPSLALLELWRPEWFAQTRSGLIGVLLAPTPPPLVAVKVPLYVIELWRPDWSPIGRPLFMPAAPSVLVLPARVIPLTLLEQWRADWLAGRRSGMPPLVVTPQGIVIRAIDLSGVAARAMDFSDLPGAAIDQSRSLLTPTDDSGDR